jgi:lambda repressor-like predicted transcriptional regulator
VASREKKPIQQYEALISNFRASGLSQRAYARSAKISFSTLKYALKKLGSGPAK